MRHFFVFLFVMLCASSYSQSDNLKVTLKNGVVIIGEMKEIAPSDHVTILIAGKETVISMSDVALVENVRQATTVTADSQENKQDAFASGQVGYYEVKDKGNYPKEFLLTIADQEVKMVLIRGGSFNMGYDGKGSLSMKSEPVHQVNLSSYYISEEPIPYSIASKMLGVKDKSSKYPFFYCNWKKAKELLSKIAENTKKPCRFITEAEWEYAALMPKAKDFFGTFKYREWCSDYFGEYFEGIQTNPQGPADGSHHVVRSYLLGKNKWDRRRIFSEWEYLSDALVRITISAEDINF